MTVACPKIKDAGKLVPLGKKLCKFMAFLASFPIKRNASASQCAVVRG